MMKTIPGDNRGSITLEACVVFPAFLAFLLFLVNMLNLCAVYLAMDHALSETVKQMAGEAYGQKGLSLKVPGLVEGMARLKLPEFYPLKNLNRQKYTIRRIWLGPEDIGLEVEYRVKLPVPFMPLDSVVLVNRAVERAWLDDVSGVSP